MYPKTYTYALVDSWQLSPRRNTTHKIRNPPNQNPWLNPNLDELPKLVRTNKLVRTKQLPLNPINYTKKRREGTTIYYNGDDVPINLEYESKCNDSDNKTILICDKDSYVLGNIIGTGLHNVALDIYKKDNEEEGYYVLRQMQRAVYGDKKIIKDELYGLFMQTYLSNEKGLNCQNICKIYDYGVFKDKNGDELGAYAVLEKLIDFEVFIQYISDTKLLNNQYTNFFEMFNGNIKLFLLNIKNILFEVLTGLECMHRNDYVHLDLKINNIGLTNLIEKKDINGNIISYKIKDPSQYIGAKIMDFGFSKKITHENPIIQEYFYIDKVQNQPPERYLLNKYIQKSDVYMFGEMLNDLFSPDLKLKSFFEHNELFKKFKKDIHTFQLDCKMLFPDNKIHNDINTTKIQTIEAFIIDIKERIKKNNEEELYPKIQEKEEIKRIMDHYGNERMKYYLSVDKNKQNKFKRLNDLYNKSVRDYSNVRKILLQIQSENSKLIREYEKIINDNYEVIIDEINRNRYSVEKILSSEFFTELKEILVLLQKKNHNNIYKQKPVQPSVPHKKRDGPSVPHKKSDGPTKKSVALESQYIDPSAPPTNVPAEAGTDASASPPPIAYPIYGGKKRRSHRYQLSKNKRNNTRKKNNKKSK